MPAPQRAAAAGLAAALAGAVLPHLVLAQSQPATAARVDQVAGISRLAGVRTDGLLIAQVDNGLRLVDREGGTYPFAGATLPGLRMRGNGARLIALAPPRPGDPLCPWRPNDLVVGTPSGDSELLHILDAQGALSTWQTAISDGTVVAAAYDQTGRFGEGLLALVRRSADSALELVDCRGGVTSVATGLDHAAGAVAVLPASAGTTLGGQAVVASARGLVAITPSGLVTALPVQGWSGMVPGGSSGVTGMAVVPRGFAERGGFVYQAGAQGLLRVSALDLVGAGVRDGDVLAAAGDPAGLLDLHCADNACVAGQVARAGDGDAAAGAPVVVATEPAGELLLPRDAERAGWTTLAAVGVGVAVFAVPALLGRRRRRAAALELEERLLHHDPAQRGQQG